MANFTRVRPVVWHILLTIFVLFTIAYLVSTFRLPPSTAPYVIHYYHIII